MNAPHVGNPDTGNHVKPRRREHRPNRRHLFFGSMAVNFWEATAKQGQPWAGVNAPWARKHREKPQFRAERIVAPELRGRDSLNSRRSCRFSAAGFNRFAPGLIPSILLGSNEHMFSKPRPA